MSVFRKYKGKRIEPDDPNWELGTWFIWKRIAGEIIHKKLHGVFTEAEAISAERTILRAAGRKVNNKTAAKFAVVLNGHADKPKPENGYLYIIESGGYHKIGQTTNISLRLKQITKTVAPFDAKLVLAVEIRGGAKDCEWHFHSRYADYCVKGEWFDLTRDQLAELKREIIDYSSIP